MMFLKKKKTVYFYSAKYAFNASYENNDLKLLQKKSILILILINSYFELSSHQRIQKK